MPSQQLFIDFNDLSDYPEGGCHAALLFLLRCAIREKDAFSLPTHIVWQAASFTKVAEDPLTLKVYTY